MRVLVGGEFSGRIRDAFLFNGHDAMSCDFSPTAAPGPHYQGDWRDVIEDGWDLAIFHPTCTYMANSGAKHLFKGMQKTGGLNEERWLQMGRDAWEFWNLLNNTPIPRIAVENPVMVGYALTMAGEKPSQIIQPWMFGDRATKATCLWLRGLKNLEPANNLGPPKTKEERRDWAEVFRMPPTADPQERRMARSKTYPGIANAMAAQWGSVSLQLGAA